MFIPIPNGVRVVHLGTFGTIEVVNTVGCQNGDHSLANPVVADSLDDIAKRHGDAWRAQIVPLINASYKHVATLAYSLEDQSAAVGDAKYASPATGGSTGTPAPLSACMVAAFRTAKRGRTYQGRSFVSGLNSGNVMPDGHTWAAAGVAAYQTAWNAYKGAVDPAIGHNGRLAVCSHGSPAKQIAPHVEPVTSILVRTQIGTQRRRLS